ncbi:MAG: non-ribosomal peptide synthetase, partial [Micromonosporaceae bacterium]|nr:non-ribosomal peptide synthetase [Micromonosporaceae bacterium]
MPRSTVVYGFADAAQQYPQHPAVLGAGPPTSYAALAAAAGGYAELLTGSGVRPGDRVGLLTLHGGQTIAAILGTLAAGAGYVPLDPAFPVSRLARMVGDAGVGTLLCDPAHEGLAGRLRPAGGRLLPAGEVPPRPLRPVPVDAGALAYVLFTSGSTGRPKAVGQTHRNLLHVVRNQIAALAPGPADRLSLLASFSFDAAIPDLYPALLTGAAVVPVDLRSLGLSEAIDELSRQSVTIYHSTPTVYRHLLAALCGRRLPAVRTVLLGGEQATYEDVRRGAQRFAPDCVFVNGYGSTEVTFAAQYQIRAGQLPPGRTGPLPIGAALPGFQLTVAEGTGELHVRSRYLAPGYLNQDSDRFTVDPDGTPRYRTGDLGTAGPEGTLVCLGRLDRQVKVRGVRVEPAEVEAVLAGLPGVGAVRVIVRDGDLLGYACPAGSASLDGPRLRTALAGQLPEQLVPRAIIVLPGLPLTVTGKVDELALPPPAGSELGQPAPDGVARTPTERAVHDLWCAVLGAERVDRSASFFDAGGDSLRLGQVQAGLADRLGVRVGMADLLAYPTIAALAGRLDRTPPAGPAAGNPAGT